MSPGRIRLLRRRLVSGLVVIAPVGITAFILIWIFRWVDNLLGRFLYPLIGAPVPGLGLLLLLLLLLGVGWATERAVGKRLVSSWHSILETFPLTTHLYGASSRIVRTVLGKERRFFREVVLFEYPSPGRWAIGFITSAAPGEVLARVPGAVSIFVPTSPNPTSGFLIMMPYEQVVPLSMTVEEGFTYILSAGAVAPVAPGASGAPAGQPPVAMPHGLPPVSAPARPRSP